MTPQQINSLSAGMRSEQLADKPEYAAQLFWLRWRIFWKHVINGKSKPLGHIVDYFVRVEFQMRGSPHLHLLFWMLEAAKALGLLENDTGLAQLADMIDKFIVTWSLPVPLGKLLYTMHQY